MYTPDTFLYFSSFYFGQKDYQWMEWLKRFLRQLQDTSALAGWLPHWLVGHAVDCDHFVSVLEGNAQSSIGIWKSQLRNSFMSVITRTQVAQRIYWKRIDFDTSPYFIPFQKKFPPMYPDKAKRALFGPPICHNSWASFNSTPTESLLKQVF